MVSNEGEVRSRGASSVGEAEDTKACMPGICGGLLKPFPYTPPTGTMHDKSSRASRTIEKCRYGIAHIQGSKERTWISTSALGRRRAVCRTVPRGCILLSSPSTRREHRRTYYSYSPFEVTRKGCHSVGAHTGIEGSKRDRPSHLFPLAPVLAKPSQSSFLASRCPWFSDTSAQSAPCEHFGLYRFIW